MLSAHLCSCFYRESNSALKLFLLSTIAYVLSAIQIGKLEHGIQFNSKLKLNSLIDFTGKQTFKADLLFCYAAAF